MQLPRQRGEAETSTSNQPPRVDRGRRLLGPAVLRTCAEGRTKVEAHARIVGSAGITGTPTLIAGGKLISGFQQAEIEAFLSSAKTAHAPR